MNDYGSLSTNNLDAYFNKVEDFLYRQDSKVNQSLCEEFLNLPSKQQAALYKVFAFLGCDRLEKLVYVENLKIDHQHRIQLARLMLLSFSLGTGKPLWSSQLLVQMWEVFLTLPDSNHSELYHAFYDILGKLNTSSLATIARFIEAVTLNGRLRFMVDDDPQTYSWINEKIAKLVNKSQAYLLIYAVPLTGVTVPTTVTLLRQLLDDVHWDSAVKWSSWVLNNPTGKQLLGDWLNEGVENTFQADIQWIIDMPLDDKADVG